MAVCGEFALDEAVGLSQGRLQKELMLTHSCTSTSRPVHKILYQSEGYLWILLRVKVSKNFRTFKFVGMLLRVDG